jgi:hypothetical protein
MVTAGAVLSTGVVALWAGYLAVVDGGAGRGGGVHDGRRARCQESWRGRWRRSVGMNASVVHPRQEVPWSAGSNPAGGTSIYAARAGFSLLPKDCGYLVAICVLAVQVKPCLLSESIPVHASLARYRNPLDRGNRGTIPLASS